MLTRWFRTRDEQTEPSFESRWRALVKRRIAVTLAIFAAWATVVEARLVYLQVIAHDKYEERALDQQQKTVRPSAPRGDILDRHGSLLAYSVTGKSVVVFPKLVENPEKTAAALCQALDDCSAAERRSLIDRLSTGAVKIVRHAQLVSPDQADRVAQLKLAGVQLGPEPVRYYPKIDLASHLLGWVNVDDDGGGGIEYALNKIIRGREGRLLVQMDRQHKWMQTTVDQPSSPGATVELSVDLNLQHIVERELAAGVALHKARGGTAIVMDPNTGEILALANLPTFNPNTFNRFTDDDRRNRAVQDVYEPGSTFKIVTASAAIEQGVVSASEIIDTSPGVIVLPGREPIREASDHNYGPISFEDVIVRSSNVGAVKVGLRVGADRMAEYVKRFGFGQTLGTDFRGQSAGKVWSRPTIDDSALASMAMGYQVSVTPLQMVTAISAVANGGLLLEPHLVRAVIKDGKREVVEPKVLQRSIKPETAATLTTFMEGVVERGTGTAAQLDRYQVAGKTGTSHKAVAGGYSKTDYNSSFVGFVPSRKPALTILVVIDTPRAGKHYGGDVAAPIFHRIAEAALAQSGVPPTIRPVPPVIVTADPGSAVTQPAKVTAPPAIVQLGGRALMPDVRGMSARDAMRALGEAGLMLHLDGSGVVVSQSPAPGEPIEPGGRSQLLLKRAGTDARGGGRH